MKCLWYYHQKAKLFTRLRCGTLLETVKLIVLSQTIYLTFVFALELQKNYCICLPKSVTISTLQILFKICCSMQRAFNVSIPISLWARIKTQLNGYAMQKVDWIIGNENIYQLLRYIPSFPGFIAAHNHISQNTSK